MATKVYISDSSDDNVQDQAAPACPASDSPFSDSFHPATAYPASDPPAADTSKSGHTGNQPDEAISIGEHETNVEEEVKEKVGQVVKMASDKASPAVDQRRFMKEANQILNARDVEQEVANEIYQTTVKQDGNQVIEENDKSRDNLDCLQKFYDAITSCSIFISLLSCQRVVVLCKDIGEYVVKNPEYASLLTSLGFLITGRFVHSYSGSPDKKEQKEMTINVIVQSTVSENKASGNVLPEQRPPLGSTEDNVLTDHDANV